MKEATSAATVTRSSENVARSPPVNPAAFPNTPKLLAASKNSACDSPTALAAPLALASMPFAASPNICCAFESDSSKSTARPTLLAPKPANATPAATPT